MLENHHCLDYEKESCPKTCKLAAATEEFRQLEAKGAVDKSTFWAHYLGTSNCGKAAPTK